MMANKLIYINDIETWRALGFAGLFSVQKGKTVFMLDLIPKIYSNIKETKMTREEAIKNCCHGIAYPEIFIQALEALGLIEFDKEPAKRKYIFFPHPDAGKDNISVYQDDAIKTLKEYGYTIHDKHGIKL